MPEPWTPDFLKFEAVMNELSVDENTVLIGHSCGCAFLVRWLGKHNKRVRKLIMVAPWKVADQSSSTKKEFYEYTINPAVKKNVGEIMIFTADNEEDDGKTSVQLYHGVLGGKIIELKGHGHYCEGDMGTTEFPELIAEILPKE